MPRLPQISVSNLDAERTVLEDALELANLPTSEIQSSKVVSRILRSLSDPARNRQRRASGNRARPVDTQSLEHIQRQLKSGFRMLLLMRDEEPKDKKDRDEKPLAIRTSGRKLQLFWDHAPDIWVRFTVNGVGLTLTDAPVALPSLSAWAAYALAVASSARWTDRYGSSKIAWCAGCGAFYLKPRRGGRPPQTCGRKACAPSRKNR
jgi:hypothetical protein